jgi:hypothetical protein
VQPTVVITVEHEMALNPGAESYMQRHDFRECQQLSVQDLNVTIYRPECVEND